MYRPSSCWLAGLLGACLAGSASAQDLAVRPDWQRENGYIALQQAARDAATDHRVLIVASHPDDRHVMPAAYLRFDRGWRVDIALMTRGEGGQNSKGPEIGDELGWRRTLESEACGALVDARTWYLNREDAGFTRSGPEALELWGREGTVRALARIIRRSRPDVVLTTHDPGEAHGHDLALLAVLPDAVRMAEDPDVELDGLPSVRVHKVFRGPAEDERAAVRDSLPMDDIDRVRGATYRQLAYAALKQHESQEPIRPMDELFAPIVHLYPMRDTEDPSAWLLQDGLPTLFDELPETDEARFTKRALDELVDKIASEGRLVREAAKLYQRLRGYRTEPGSDAAIRIERRLEALTRIIRYGSGLRVTANLTSRSDAVAGQSADLQLRVQNGGEPIFRDLRFACCEGDRGSLDVRPHPLMETLPPGAPFVVDATYRVPPMRGERREWFKRLFEGEAFVPPIRIECTVRVEAGESAEGFDTSFTVVVPAGVRPPVELDVSPRALLLPRGRHTVDFNVYVARNTAEVLDTQIEVLGPPGFIVDRSPTPIRMELAQYRDFPFQLRVPESLRPGVYNLHVRVGEARAVVPLHKVDVVVPDSLRVGLIRGVDDTAQAVLQAYVGDGLEILDAEKLATRELAAFDTIVVDIRALRERSGSSTWRAARAAFPRLLRFAEGGGRLVVLYHKDTEFNPDQAGYVGAPFALTLGKGRVTREDAPVELLKPEHPLITVPNQIQPEDWDGWVQERGLYFPSDYASSYEEILAMADPGEVAQRGALLYARHGKGEYVYCALALYRQLDSLHPGACRLFANLIAR